MKTLKLYSIVLSAILIFILSQNSFAQLANFYSSPNYSNFINNMISNSIWQSSMEKYTKEYKAGSAASKSDSAKQSLPEFVPEYRRYPAVQFKSTGSRLTLQTYLDAVDVSAQEKAELKELVLKIFSDYEATAAAKSYPNDWALAYVSYIGLNSHIYYGRTEKPIIAFEQNVGLRDVVAEHATDNGIFHNVTDKEKQELYELLIMVSGLTYYYYEKAYKENNAKEIENCKLAAAQQLKLIGINPPKL
jgi:hypothetical protein